MKFTKRYAAFLSLFLLALAAAFFDRTLITGYLIDPLSRIVWWVVRLFQVVDQEVYWTLLIFAFFVFTLRLLPNAPQRVDRRSTYSVPLKPEDRVAYWEKLLRAAGENTDARQELQHNLKALDASIDALMDGEARAEINLALAEPGLLQKKLIKARRAIQRMLPGAGGGLDDALYRSVDPILTSMEKILEIQNDTITYPADDR